MILDFCCRALHRLAVTNWALNVQTQTAHHGYSPLLLAHGVPGVPADQIIPAFRRRSPSQPADTACSLHTVICNYGNAQLPLNAKRGLHLSLSSSSEVDSDKYCCLTPQVRAAISKITPVALLVVELSDITTDPTCRLAATLCGEAHATDIRVYCTDCRSGAAMQ